MNTQLVRIFVALLLLACVSGRWIIGAEKEPVGKVVAAKESRLCELRFTGDFKPVVGQNLSVFRRADADSPSVYVSTVQVSDVQPNSISGRYTHVEPVVGDLLYNMPLLDGFGSELGQIPEQVSTTIELAALVEAVRGQSTSVLFGAQKRFQSEALLDVHFAGKEKREVEAATERARKALRLAELDRRNALAAKQRAEEQATLAEEAVKIAARRVAEEDEKLKDIIRDIENKRSEAKAALAAKEDAERLLAEATATRDRVAGALQAARDRWSKAATDAEKRSEVAIAIIKFMSGETDELFSVNPGKVLAAEEPSDE